MLTDLHVHLRPDDPGTTAERHFTQANAERYLTAAEQAGVDALGVSEHVHRFRQALGIWDHPFWRQNAVDDLDRYCDWVRDETPLLLGIEADWVPGREERIAALLEARPFDYVLGSVHFLRDRAVDMDGDWDVWRGADAEEVWRRYFAALADAAGSGLFDVLSHPDLVKVWGGRRPRPDGDLRRFYEPAVEAIAESGVAVEVSTAGLRKPAGEIYPAPALLGLLVEAEVPLALSSDAHLPEQVGFRYGDALELLRSFGVERIAVFERRERRLEPLG